MKLIKNHIRFWPIAFVLGTSLMLLIFTSATLPADDRKQTASKAPAMYKHRFIAFGTYIDIVITQTSETEAKAAFKEIEQEILYRNQVWNPYKPSAVARLNKLLPGTVWFSMAPSVHPLLVRAIELSKLSDHLFNPAIGKLIRLWGFYDSSKPRQAPPAPEAIAALVKTQPRMSQLSLDGVRLKSSNANVQLDFGAIAKGFALNEVIDILKRRGIKNAIVNAGGDLKCLGTRGHRPWRIAIRNPVSKQKLFGSVQVKQEEAVFTSGDYERYFIHNHKRYHHILDPRTGYPANQTRSVTVIHPDAALADAAATALFIAGPKDWRRIAKRMKLTTVLLIDKQGKIYMTPHMYNRLTLYVEHPVSIEVIPLD